MIQQAQADITPSFNLWSRASYCVCPQFDLHHSSRLLTTAIIYIYPRASANLTVNTSINAPLIKNPVPAQGSIQAESILAVPELIKIEPRPRRLKANMTSNFALTASLTQARIFYGRASLQANFTLTYNQYFLQIWNLRRMSTPYREGHDIRYEITDEYAYNDQIKTYTQPKFIYRFRVPYRASFFGNITASQNTLLGRIRRTVMDSANIISTIVAPPYNFTKAQSYLESVVNLVAPPYNFTKAQAGLSVVALMTTLNSRLRGFSELAFSIATMITNNLRKRKIQLDSIDSVTEFTGNNNYRKRTSPASLENISTLSGTLSGKQRGSGDLTTVTTLEGIGGRSQIAVLNPYDTATTLSGDDVLRPRISYTNLGNTTSLEASVEPGPFTAMGYYYPGDGFDIWNITLADDYSLVVSRSSTTSKVELIDTSTRTSIRTFTMPNNRNVYIPNFIRTFNTFLIKQSCYAMSSNYVACLSDDGTSRYVEIFNKSTGAHLYSLTSTSTSPGKFQTLTISDTIIAVARTTNNSTFNRLEFYNIVDGSFISGYNPTSPLPQPIQSNGQGKFLWLDNINNGNLRVYDISSSSPSYIQRNLRDDQSFITLGQNLWSYITQSTNSNFTLANGTKPFSYDINNLTTNTTSRYPEVANYPIIFTTENDIFQGSTHIAMNDEYIVTFSQDRNDYYLTSISDLKKKGTFKSGQDIITTGTTDALTFSSNTTRPVYSSDIIQTEFRLPSTFTSEQDISLIYLPIYRVTSGQKYLIINLIDNTQTTREYYTVVYNILGVQDFNFSHTEVTVSYLQGTMPPVGSQCYVAGANTLNYTLPTYQDYGIMMTNEYIVIQNKFYQNTVN